MKSIFLILSLKSNNYFLKRFSFDFQNKAIKTKNLCLFLTLFVLSFCANAQQKQVLKDSIKTEKLDEVLVKAVRVASDAPITHSNISKEEIAKRNLGQDIPILLNYLPSVVTTSDAGAGVGYTGIRVRGTDATRVNVTINGIPYNDPESQGTFWVNLGDFASSTESIQLQRGVGTSTNGSGAFGASLNLLTDASSKKANAEISNAFGSFNTRKHTVKMSTGQLYQNEEKNQSFEVSGRFSNINSDGYIDRAFTELKSYFIQGVYKDNTTLIKALTFGNEERTYQAWAGLTKEQLEQDRRQNPYTYENETDNYWQDHYQFHWNERFDNNLSTNIGLNYTKGEGYFEQYKAGESAEDFNNLIEDGSDVIVRRWLDNDFYVANANLNYKTNKLNIISGISFSTYSGDHFGEVIWGNDLAPNTNIRDTYYNGDATKLDFSMFTKTSFVFAQKFTSFIDLQRRIVQYKTDGTNSNLTNFKTNASFHFFNPKIGLTFKHNESNSYYASFAVANREPNRNDFEAGVTENENLNDVELGWRYNTKKVNLSTNMYYMFYKNQLVLTGELDDTANPIRATSGKSFRLGLEIDANVKFCNFFDASANVAISRNKNIDFKTEKDGELVNLGNTNISYSPELVIGESLNFHPAKNLQISFLSKYVGEQYMSNTDSKASILESYLISDLNLNYTITPKSVFKSIVLSALVNNIFNTEYVSNGYYYTYDDDWSVPGSTTTIEGTGYYPQATRNFLLGATLKF